MATPTTLPASFVAGQVLTAAQQNALRGAFRVLQVVQGTTSTTVSNSTNTYADTGLTATITPSATSSKILVLVSHPDCNKSSANALNRMAMQLHRAGASIAQIVSGAGFNATAQTGNFGINYVYLDSPASVAALTYKTTFMNVANGAAVTVNGDAVEAATITLMEISA